MNEDHNVDATAPSHESPSTMSTKEESLTSQELRLVAPESASSIDGMTPSCNVVLEQEILLDLGSTYSDSNMDALLDEESGEERVASPCLWGSCEESSEDETMDPLFFYSSRCVEQDGQQQEETLACEPSLAQSQSIQPCDVGSSPASLKEVSFINLKPLYGHLMHSSSDTSGTTATTQSSNDSSVRFRDYQCTQWAERFEELRKFSIQYGHCQVSHRDTEHSALARWSKRQRYQYKLMNDGKQSTMTPARVEALNELHFAWNTHEAVWNERFAELVQFNLSHGHCNVPSCYDPNQKLATWAKCQRRQYKLLVNGRKSNMTWQRVARLEELGFVWELRSQMEIQHS